MTERKFTLDDLSHLKSQLKQQIYTQEKQIKFSAQHLIPTSPLKLISNVTNLAGIATGIMSSSKKNGNSFSLINGAILGYKMVKIIRHFIKKRK